MKKILFLATFVVALMSCNKTNTAQTTPQEESLNFPIKGQLCEASKEPFTCTTMTNVQINPLDSFGVYDVVPIDVLKYDEESVEILSNVDQYIHLDTNCIDSLAIQYADFYNVLTMMYSLFNDMEVTERYETPTAVQMSQMDCSVIHSPTLRNLIEKTRDAYVKVNKADTQKNQDNVQKGMEDVYMELSDIIVPVIETTRDSYAALSDRSSYWTNFAEVDSLRGAGNENYQKQLLATYQNATNFDLKCIWALEFAHSSDENVYFLPGAALLEEVMLSGQYSPYLDEMWATWRAIVSTLFPRSNYGYIPNIFYNKMRLRCATTMLDYIKTNPNDLLAQASFIFLASRENIVRHGFIAGNSSAVEQMTMFPEWQ